MSEIVSDIDNTLLASAAQRTNCDFHQIIGHSKPMQKVFLLMGKILNSGATVLLRGETGTGKEVIARALHYNSHRKQKNFVVQNCAALPGELLESELFGYKKGAFSGANADKKGLIEVADGGTLLLDEIGDMPIGLQAKLLRVLQDKIVRPLGSEEGVGKLINVRFVVASHCDLKEKIKTGQFREDLYYRLCVFPIDLPPLNKRKEDIPELLQYFLEKLATQNQKNIVGFSQETLAMLVNYAYPGNVRELRNIVERGVLMCDAGGQILPEHLTEEVHQTMDQNRCRGSQSVKQRDTLKEKVEKYEAYLIRKKLSECRGNQTRAASELEIARRTIIEKIKRYSITKNSQYGEFLNQTNEFYSN
jgi:sigma-54-dependent transcriptional regulator